MTPLIATIVGFLGKRSFHFAIYAVIGLCVWGIYQKLFSATNTTTVGDGGKIVNVYADGNDSRRVPLGGCSAYRVSAEAYWKRPNVRP